MSEKINLSDYFQTWEPPAGSRVCDSPEDIEATERINREMEIVNRKARNAFALSRELVRGLILTRAV